MHGREKQAEASIAEIEQDVAATKGESRRWTRAGMEIGPTEKIGYLALLRCLFRTIRAGRSTAGADDHPSFLYNAIFFTYGLVLLYFFHVPAATPPTTSWRSQPATCSAR